MVAKDIYGLEEIFDRNAERYISKLFPEDRADVRRFVAWLQRSGYKEWTRRDLKVILRRYMRWLGKGEAVAWMEIKHPKSGTLPEEVLTEEEIKAIAEAAYTTRDKASQKHSLKSRRSSGKW